mgnify:FL=1
MFKAVRLCINATNVEQSSTFLMETWCMKPFLGRCSNTLLAQNAEAKIRPIICFNFFSKKNTIISIILTGQRHGGYTLKLNFCIFPNPMQQFGTVQTELCTDKSQKII